MVQELCQGKKRTLKQMDEPNLFSGLVFCADCGKPLVLHRAHTMETIKNNFMCYTYKKRGKEVCSSHYIREHDLMRIILDALRRVTHFARQKVSPLCGVHQPQKLGRATERDKQSAKRTG